MLEEPAVRLGIPRLAGRHDRAERREIDPRPAVRDQGPHERRRDAEDGRPLALDQRPDTIRRVVGRAFRQDERATERAAADDGPWAHDPAHVRREEDDVVGMGVGVVGDLARDRDEKAPVDVEHALRPAARPGRVRKEVWVLSVDLERPQLAGAGGNELVPEDVPPYLHRQARSAEAPPDHDALDRRHRPHSLVDDLLHLELAAAPQRPVCSDYDLRVGVLEPRGDGRSGEAREDGHLDRADVGAGMRGDCDLGGHGQEERDGVAGAHAERDEPFREPRDLGGHLALRQRGARSVLGGEDRRNRVGAPLGPAVYAIPGDVQGPADEPGRPFRSARNVHYLVPRARELQAHVLDRCGPEPLRILLRPALKSPVVVESMPAHQPDDVRPVEHLLRGRPDDLGHGAGSVVEGDLTSVLAVANLVRTNKRRREAYS